MGRGVLGRASFHPTFDEVFDRGIDPDVDDPEQCHPHSEIPDRWPDLDEVIAYRDRVRREVLAAIPGIETRASTDVMAQRGRVLAMVFEHELMHHETLLYMVREMPSDQVRRPMAGVR